MRMMYRVVKKPARVAGADAGGHLKRQTKKQAARQRPRTPYRQGDLDGLCGVYSAVNAIRALCPEIDTDDAGWLFDHLIQQLPKAGANVSSAVANGIVSGELARLSTPRRSQSNRRSCPGVTATATVQCQYRPLRPITATQVGDTASASAAQSRSISAERRNAFGRRLTLKSISCSLAT